VVNQIVSRIPNLGALPSPPLPVWSKYHFRWYLLMGMDTFGFGKRAALSGYLELSFDLPHIQIPSHLLPPSIEPPDAPRMIRNPINSSTANLI